MRKLLFIFFLLLGAVRCLAAPPVVSAQIEPSEGLIGDRFTLTVKVSKDVMQVVNFPTFQGGKIAPGVELLAEYAPDTISMSGRSVILAKRYDITSFDAGRYSLSRFPVLYLDKNVVDTLRAADSLRFVVNTFEIDTAKQTIYDIKAVERTPLVLGEFEGYLFGGVLLALIIAAAVIMTARYIARRNGREVKPERPAEPAHVTAIRDLEALLAQHLWQAGKIKAYYTALTDILRRYLSGRYAIDAMESTTDEILEQLQELTAEQYDQLRKILQLSDIVKFAKGVPTEDENEQVWSQTYDFVEETKEEIEVNG